MSAATERRPRNTIALAATLTLIGIALSASGNASVGAWVTLVGLVMVIYGLHRFGRTGADEPLPFAPRKQKKKKKRRSAEEEE
ncbi:MAG: hypothetical protein KC776_32600 [Myxococcales bacterium]|nr:hypothetical protein [Myxococcales bacterium]